jgi:hypothetical protein
MEEVAEINISGVEKERIVSISVSGDTLAHERAACVTFFDARLSQGTSSADSRVLVSRMVLGSGRIVDRASSQVGQMVLARGTKIGWAPGPQTIVYLYMKEKCKEKM